MSEQSLSESFDSLKEEVERCMLVELLDANQFVSKETVLLRVLRKLCSSLDVPWSSLLDSTKTTYYIDPDVQILVMQCWNQRNLGTSSNGSSNNSPSLASFSDDQAVIERIVSRDYVRSVDLVKLASVLTKRCSPEIVSQIFAVDGFAGKEPKRYVEFFKYPADDYRGRHVRFVRMAYQSVPKTERIFAIIKVALDSFQNGSLISKYLTTDGDDGTSAATPLFEVIYASPEDKLEVLEDGRTLLYTPLMDSIEMQVLKSYVDYVGFHNLEKIADWKHKQLNNDGDSTAGGNKKVASSKRKRPSTAASSKGSKKVATDSEVVAEQRREENSVETAASKKMKIDPSSKESEEYLSTSSESQD